MTLPRSVQRAQVAAAGVRNYCEGQFLMSVSVLVTAIPEEDGGGYATQMLVTGRLPADGVAPVLGSLIEAHQMVARQAGKLGTIEIPAEDQAVLGRLAAVTLGDEPPKAGGDA